MVFSDEFLILKPVILDPVALRNLLFADVDVNAHGHAHRPRTTHGNHSSRDLCSGRVIMGITRTRLEVCSLEAHLRNARGVKGIPPQSVAARGVACMSPTFMQQHSIVLFQAVLLRTIPSPCPDSCGSSVDGSNADVDHRQCVALAWPLASLADGSIAVDPMSLASLGLRGRQLGHGRPNNAGVRVGASPARRGRARSGRSGRTPKRTPTKGDTARQTQDGTEPGTRENGESGPKTNDPVTVTLHIVEADEILDAEEIVLVPDDALPPRGASLIESPEYVNMIRRGIQSRLVVAGSMVQTQLLGTDVLLSVASIATSGSDHPVRVVTERTRVDVRASTDGAQARQADIAEQPRLEDVGGLSRLLESVLEMARRAFGAEEPHGHEGAPRSTGVPRGVLLYGPPGTGKTMVARAVAAACHAHTEVVSGPEVVGAVAGESEQNLERVFQRASERRPCVVVLDEVDVIGPRRDGATATSADRRLTAALLRLLDDSSASGTDGPLAGVFVIGTTNRVDALDKALRRAGRFDEELHVDVPDSRARYDIMSRLVSRTRAAGALRVSDAEVRELMRKAHGFVGADLAALWRETVARAMERCGADALFVEASDMTRALGAVKPSSLREVEVEVPEVRWDDVGGVEEVKRRLREAVEQPLSEAGAAAFRAYGVQPPRGILLYGPPGCSKTLLARAVATESGANFISVKGPELLSKWVGESEKAVRETFRKARLAAPCVVFFDEIDALASQRGSGGSAESRVVAQLLTELDSTCGDGGAADVGGVVVIGATNRPDLLDSALVRAGRLGVKLHVGLPDADARLRILEVHARSVPLAPDVQLGSWCGPGAAADGMSGAELAAVVREAALAALDEGGEGACQVEARHFEAAFTRVRPRTPPAMLAFFHSYAMQQRS